MEGGSEGGREGGRGRERGGKRWRGRGGKQGGSGKINPGNPSVHVVPAGPRGPAERSSETSGRPPSAVSGQPSAAISLFVVALVSCGGRPSAAASQSSHWLGCWPPQPRSPSVFPLAGPRGQAKRSCKKPQVRPPSRRQCAAARPSGEVLVGSTSVRRCTSWSAGNESRAATAANMEV